VERLRSGDQRRLFEYVFDLYTLRDHSAFVSHLISTLGTLIPCERISYNEFHARPRHVRAVWYPADEKLAQKMLPIFQHFLHQHPIVPYLKKTGNGRSVRLSDLMSPQQFQRSALYNEYYRRIGVQHQLGSSLAVTPSLLVPMALNRARPNFSDRERLLFTLLGPHVAQAFRNAQAVSHWQRERDMLHEVVDQLDRGVMEVTGRGKIVWATPRALALVRQYGKCRLQRSDRIPEILRDWIRRQTAAFANSTEIPVPPEPLTLTQEGRHLRISLVKRSDNMLLFFEEETRGVELSELQQLGLTVREAEVLKWVTLGKSNGDIALLLDAREKTIKKHIERIFQKLGVESRLAAATLVMSLAKGFGRSCSR
jgi:DNA-binding CsgD family transcriptional regulator